MKKNMKTLSAIAVSGLLLGLAATPAFAEHDQATGKTDGHADHGCNGSDKASGAGSKDEKSSCNGKEAKPNSKASCSGKEGCGATEKKK